MKASDLTLIRTSIACPEQYDVYYGNTQIAYIRYRYGYFACYPYNYKNNDIDFNTVIYDWEVDDLYAGILEDSERYVLEEAKKAICKYYDK